MQIKKRRKLPLIACYRFLNELMGVSVVFCIYLYNNHESAHLLNFATAWPPLFFL